MSSLGTLRQYDPVSYCDCPVVNIKEYVEYESDTDDDKNDVKFPTRTVTVRHLHSCELYKLRHIVSIVENGELCGCSIVNVEYDYTISLYGITLDKQVVEIQHHVTCEKYRKCECNLIITKNIISRYSAHRIDCKITKKRIKKRALRKRKNKILAELQIRDIYATAYWIDYKRFGEKRINYTYDCFLKLFLNGERYLIISLFRKLYRNVRMLIFEFIGKCSQCHNQRSHIDFLRNQYRILFNPKTYVISYHHTYNYSSSQFYNINGLICRTVQLYYQSLDHCYDVLGCVESFNNCYQSPNYSFELDLPNVIINIIIDYLKKDNMYVFINSQHTKDHLLVCNNPYNQKYIKTSYIVLSSV